MNIQEMVREFHARFGLPIADKLANVNAQRNDLRVKLLLEEVSEYIQAAADGNLVEVADGLGDIVVIAFGTALEYGIDLNAVLAEIHRGNMSKLDENGCAIINECINAASTHRCPSDSCLLRDESLPLGKVLKSKNYRKPDVATVLGLK